MRLSQVRIENYRNLSGLSMSFHPLVTFIVGENNLGKTNIIHMLDILFNQTRFYEEDFFDSTKAIEIEIQFLMSEIEIGLFEDLFDPEGGHRINIVAKQENPDEPIVFHHKETGTYIEQSRVKCINYVRYDSLRNPSQELNFNSRRGVGKVFGHIVNDYIKKNDLDGTDLINATSVDGLLEDINSKLSKIKTLKDFEISAVLESKIEDILAKLVVLQDDKGFKLEKAGYGIQFLSLFPLVILEKILSLNKKRFARSLFIDESNKSYMPMLLGLDEPEVHLHPYMQRALVRYLIKVLNNKDEQFSDLVKILYGIDNISGQLLITTHSPNIILDSYKHINHIYKDTGLKVNCGTEIHLSVAEEKQLYMNMPYIKEAFFSKCVFLVEGQSELGAVPIFAERERINLDELGISIIQAGSGDSIPPLVRLLNQFGIKNVSIIDKDKFDEKPELFKDITNLYHTDGIDFEEEIFNHFSLTEYVKFVENTEPARRCFLAGDAKKLNIEIDYSQETLHTQLDHVDSALINQLRESLKAKCISNLRNKKSIIFGRILAESVTNIPSTYMQALSKAKEMAQNV